MGALCSALSKLTCYAIGSCLQIARRRFPPVVRVETTNRCNARCRICPHRFMTRPVQTMSDALYRQVIDECAENRCREVQLHNFGEPLLDRSLPERIAYAKRQGIRKVKFFSNGSLLNEAWARELLESGLDEIKISLDGATKEEFEWIRPPLRFERVVDNIHRLVVLRDRRGSPLRVFVVCCSTSDRGGTIRAVEDAVDGFSFSRVHNWADREMRPLVETRERIRKACARLWRTCTVLASGDVALCCLDYDGQHLLGHLDARTSLREVWQGQAYVAARRLHLQARQAEIPLCRDCSKSFLRDRGEGSLPWLPGDQADLTRRQSMRRAA